MNTDGGSELAASVAAIGHDVVAVVPGVGVEIRGGEIIASVTWELDDGHWLYTARFA